MHIRPLTTFCSILLIIIGGISIYAWLFHIQAILQPVPGLMALPFNDAVCFFLTGILLFKLQFSLGYQQGLFIRSLLIFILIIALLSFSQNIFDYNLGIKQLMVKPWFTNPSPSPDKASPSTSVAFILSCIVGLLLPLGHKKIVGSTIQILTLAILFIALTSLLIYTLKLEFIFPWYHSTGMAIQTGLSFIIVSIAWWSLWSQSSWCRKFYEQNQDKKIIFIVGIVLSTLSLSVGIGGIAGLTYTHMFSLNKHLEEVLHDKISTFNHETNEIEGEALELSKDPLLQNAYTDKAHRTTDILNNISSHTRLKHFTALALEDLKKQQFFLFGQFSQPELSLPIQSEGLLKQLSWSSNHFWFKTTVPVYSNTGNRILLGYLVVETPLEGFSNSYLNYNTLGETGEMRICKKEAGTNMTCFPSRFTPKPFYGSYLYQGLRIPIGHALENKAGTINATDYRGQMVAAAFEPLGKTGLGMVIKINRSEIYAPLRKQLAVIFPLALLLILFGLALVFWQVSPLVKKLISANNLLSKSLENLNKKKLEETLLKKFNLALQVCLASQEAAQVVATFSKKIFPKLSGALYIMYIGKDYLECVSSWGPKPPQATNFKPTECWGIRFSTPYLIDNIKNDLLCVHAKALYDKQAAYLCIPLYVQNALVGLFYLQTEKQLVDLLNSSKQLAITVSRQISLCLSNILLQERLRHQSLIDSLTGLHNRRFLDESLESELARAKRNGLTVGILMIDIDYFKKYNDSYGHEAGDQVLKKLGEVVLQHIRPYDVACRYGGEEFTVILSGISPELALERTELLRVAISQLIFNVERDNIPETTRVTVSIGIAFYPQDADNAHDVIAMADHALYEAKNNGRNQAKVYTKKA
ncbi:MAG: diguanylate cyclase domain protein [Gammaproteobacteria bacterium]|jgi:diguanylate cyclase (GGDEF)-like protein|nr:diguanylate cyclase domain protein [Gammaproteobacteria bacterium]